MSTTEDAAAASSSPGLSASNIGGGGSNDDSNNALNLIRRNDEKPAAPSNGGGGGDDAAAATRSQGDDEDIVGEKEKKDVDDQSMEKEPNKNADAKGADLCTIRAPTTTTTGKEAAVALAINYEEEEEEPKEEENYSVISVSGTAEEEEEEASSKKKKKRDGVVIIADIDDDDDDDNKDIEEASSSNSKSKTKRANPTSTTGIGRMAKRPSVILHVQNLEDFILTWESLTVHVPGASKGCCGGCCSDKDNPLWNCAVERCGVAMTESDPFYALQSVSGHVQTGEMVLVLAADGQHSSTLIRALTGRLSSRNVDVTGTLSLNGSPLGQHAMRLQAWRRLAAHVDASDATHAAVLTVRETLDFAVACTWAADTPPEKLQDVVDDLLEFLDLAHVADTVVGDENIRGVSGGQKRRVTVGEMLIGESSRFLGLDSITDGLSSKDSFNLIQLLSQACQSYKKAAVISLLQPSDEMVALFDKILVLNQAGQCAYFGPPHRPTLEQVFLGGIPTETEGSICDLVLRRFDDPQDEVAVVQRFMASSAFADMQRTIQTTNSATLVMPAARTFLPESKYAKTAWYQFQVIGRRRCKLIARNAVTYTRIGIAVVFGVIIGSLFSELNNDLVGSLSRTGYIFLHNFLVLMLSAAITIPSTFRERVTLYKHRAAEFYSSRVAYITQVVLDIPLSLLEAILLSCISYWWVEMNPGVNNFFYFMGILCCLECVGQAFGRFLCAVSRTQVLANTLSSVLIFIFGTVAGFMPGFNSIPTILRWLSWVTPASYGFEGLMINEFGDADRTLSLAVINNGNSTTQIGTIQGTEWLSMTDLPRSSWTSLQGLKGFDIVMILVLAVVFDLLGCYYTERNREWYFQQIRRPQRKAVSVGFQEKDKKNSNSGSKNEVAESAAAATDSSKDWPTTLIAKDTCYYVPLKRAPAPKRLNMHSLLEPCLVGCFGKNKGDGDKEEKPSVQRPSSSNKTELQLLTSVNARFERRRMTALMGTSGAGKTTLLDVIAGYKTGGRITGDILIDGVPKNTRVWKKVSAYAEQNDILNPYMSVLETLRFTAACGLAGTAAHRAEIIDQVVETMQLEDWVDMIIGREKDGEGLPKHARKRVTIAVQLVLQPKILFLDEPTTGLSTIPANIVMQAIRRCTDKMNLITVATIHQPSKTIWDAFDDLLLLVKGGQVAYAGEMGENSKFVIDYFSRLSGVKPPNQVNPADFAIAAVTRVSPDEAADAFKGSGSHSDLIAKIKADEGKGANGAHHEAHNTVPGRRNNPFMELMLLTKRHFIVQWRNPSYSFLRLISCCFVSVYLGLLFFGDKSTVDGAIYTIGSLFFIVFVLVIPMQSSVVPLIEDRAVLYREATSGLYSRWSYGIGQLLSDIPFHMLNTVIMFVSFYFLVGFRPEADRMGYFILLLFLSNWVIMSIGQLFALVTPNEESANGLAGLSVILSVILMGFLIMVSAMPSGWVWAYWANLFHYIVQGFVTNELAGTNYELIPPTNISEDLFNVNATATASSDMLANASSAFVFAPGTELEVGSVAQQASNFMLLATQAAPGQNYNWNNSGIGVLADLLDCMVENNCLVDPLLTNFISCAIFSFPQSPPCGDQFTKATETIDLTALFQCFEPVSSASSSIEDAYNGTSGNAARGVPSDFTMDTFNVASEMDQLSVILCLVGVLLPPALVTDIQKMLEGIFKGLFDLVMIVIDIIENGIAIPGELILWVFGWAEWDDGELSAPWKWYYCMFAVAMFLAGIELLKLFAIRFIIWTKR